MGMRNSAEHESYNQEQSAGIIERLRNNKTVVRGIGSVAALGAVAAVTFGYTNASKNGESEVSNLSNRITAAVLEDYQGDVDLELYRRNVLFVEGSKFYQAPQQVEDSRFFGLVQKNNEVEVLEAGQTRQAETALVMTGVGGVKWMGIRVIETQGELAVDQGDNDELTTSDSSSFTLQELQWTPVLSHPETNEPTVYCANTDEAITEMSINEISVSADIVNITGSNVGNVAVSRDIELDFSSILSFNDTFYGSEITCVLEGSPTLPETAAP